MEIIIDTNILISALIKDSTTRKILIKSNCKFYYPEFSFQEIIRHEGLILKKSKISRKEYKRLVDALMSIITVIPQKEIEKHMNTAKDLIGSIDADDAIFIAAALTKDSIIWSDDKHLKKQEIIKVLNTSQMYQIFS